MIERGAGQAANLTEFGGQIREERGMPSLKYPELTSIVSVAVFQIPS